MNFMQFIHYGLQVLQLSFDFEWNRLLDIVLNVELI